MKMKYNVLLIVAMVAQTGISGLYIHKMPNTQKAAEDVITIERWNGGESVSVLSKPSISPEDVIRIFIEKRVIPGVTQEQIDAALSKMSEEQREKIAKAWKPSHGKTEVILSFVLTNEGAKSFGILTKECVSQKLAMVVDGKFITAPVVNEPILNGIVTLTVDLDNAPGLLEAFPSSNPKVFMDSSMMTE